LQFVSTSLVKLGYESEVKKSFSAFEFKSNEAPVKEISLRDLD